MGKLTDLTGMTFGRLTVKNREENDKTNNSKWLCVCECGTEKVIWGHSLKSGNSKSCGCLSSELVAARKLIHGKDILKIFAPEYNTWSSMMSRCLNPKHPRFKDWGGRGITVCTRWLTFSNFLDDMGKRPSNGYSIERIDNEKGYNPDNCMWIKNSDQALNRRPNNRNTSGHVGVHWAKNRNKWTASICVNYKSIKLGNYEMLSEAVEARKQAELKYLGKSS